MTAAAATSASVGRAFDAMADEYDDVQAPYYRHWFDVVDRLMQRELGRATPGQRALDLCCGTGIQSLRLAGLGYRVTGVDLAPQLLAIARRKLAAAGHADALFVEGDAASLPSGGGAFDLVNCCGAMSMVPHWRQALSEIARCLKPGGRLLLEVEGKWNGDLAWQVVNALAGNVLGYDEPLRVSLGHFLPPWREGPRIEYSFKLESGGAVTLPLKLFTAAELQDALGSAGLRPLRRWGIHAVTNVLPSTVLHRPLASRVLRGVFAAAAALERRVNGRWPFNALGCSLVVVAEKEA
jgi:ubiquinone/menaquinone biosynthesis C-methylase UbiE